MAEDLRYLTKVFKKFLRKQENDKKATKDMVSKEQPLQSGSGIASQGKKVAIPKKQSSIKLKVEKAKKIEVEETEEFEPVQGARPALCINKRKAKLKWKKGGSEKTKKYGGIQYDAPDSNSTGSPPSPSAGELNIGQLKDVLLEPTLEKQLMKKTIERLRQRLTRRDKKIEKLQKELKVKTSELPVGSDVEAKKSITLQSSASWISSAHSPAHNDNILVDIQKELNATKAQLAKQTEAVEKSKNEMTKLLEETKGNNTGVKKKKNPNEETIIEEFDLDEVTQEVAIRCLAVLKRNQLLEKALPTKEIAVLYQYFSASGVTKPSHEVLTLLDKSIGGGIETMVRRPQDLDDPIDNQMRQLLMETNKAKSILLEVMLTHPEYVPNAWGGGTLMVTNHRKQDTTTMAPSARKKTEKWTEQHKEKEQESFFGKSSHLPVKKRDK